MGKPHRIAPDVKEQILRRIKDDGVTVAQAAKDHGIHETTIYGWLSTGVAAVPTLRELRMLKKENAMLKELVGELTVKLSRAQKKS
ncbi:MAG: transposase [Candidatus Shapirobacteria bacterium]|jgi:transposase-like protein